MGGNGLDLSSLELGSEWSACEYYDESSNSVHCKEFYG